MSSAKWGERLARHGVPYRVDVFGWVHSWCLKSVTLHRNIFTNRVKQIFDNESIKLKLSDRQKPKRRHHHVWQFYLRPWTHAGAIWCLQDNRVFVSGTSRVAVEKDFYKFHPLTGADERMVNWLFKESHPAALRSFRSLIDKLMRPFQMAEANRALAKIRRSGRISTNMRRRFLKNSILASKLGSFRC